MAEPNGKQKDAQPIGSGLVLMLEIRIDKAALPKDGIALGACVADLRREGWQLVGLGDQGGDFIAQVRREWLVQHPLPPAQAQPSGPRLVRASELPD